MRGCGEKPDTSIPSPNRYVTNWDAGIGYMQAPEVEVTDNPVVAELLGPDGRTVRQWRERPTIGYR